MAELYRTERSWGIQASCTGKVSVLNNGPLPRVRTSLPASHYMAYAITSFALHGIAMTTILFRDIITWHDDIALLISTPFDLFHVISTHDMSKCVVTCGKVILLQMARQLVNLATRARTPPTPLTTGSATLTLLLVTSICNNTYLAVLRNVCFSC